MIYIGPTQAVVNARTCSLMAAGDAGTYTITCVPPAIVPDTTTIVTGKTILPCTFPAIGTYVITITDGVSSDTCSIYVDMLKCLVYGTIVDVLGNPLRNAEITISPETDGPELSIVAATAYTNHLGFFSIRLLRDMVCVIHVHDTAYKKKITIPDANSVDIKDL